MQAPQFTFELMDESIFNLIDPPQQYPPTLDYFMQQCDNYFIKQCNRFLINERQTYDLSKKVETNLQKMLDSSKQVQSMVLSKDSNNERIFKELRKLNENQNTLIKRSETLGMICDMIKLENLKGLLLLESEKAKSQQQLSIKANSKTFGSDKQITQPNDIHKLISDSQKRTYLQNLTKVYTVIKQSKQLQDLITQNKFPLILSILVQLHQLFSKAIDKALSQEMLTPDMIKLILEEFYEPFLFDENLYIRMKKTPKQKFTQVMVSNRVQKYRLELNPLINNLNYANNVIDLYDSILETWVRIIDQDLKLFSKAGEVAIVKTATKMMLNEGMPKLQKNTYKMKQMSQLCFIRFKVHQFLGKLNSMQLLQSNDDKQRRSQQKWQPLPDMLQKMKIFLEAKIQQEAQKLSSTKYNIYSLTSYIPIRQYLETIKQCIEYDFERPPDLEFIIEEQEQGEKMSRSLNNSRKEVSKYLDWEMPFYQLASSRKPQTQQNNKSLVIFNLNIWYLYLKIVKQPSYKVLAVETMMWCKQKFIEMNIKECMKVYYESLDKVLQMCGNLPVFRSTFFITEDILYAQISMLGHEDLRKEIAGGIKQKFLVKYAQILQKIGKSKMDNEEVKTFCKENKINLNKFGKFSNQICIYSVQELRELIEFN